MNKLKHAIAFIALSMLPVTNALAATDIVETLDNTQNLIFSIIRIIGIIGTAFGLLQFGMSFSSHDPSQRNTGIMCIVGGLIMALAEPILAAIGVL